MSEEEKEVIEELKRTIKNSNYCDSIGTGQIEILLNYIDKLQKEVQYEKNEKMNLAGMLDEKDEEIKSLETDLEIGNNICAKLQKENEDMREELQMYVDTDVMILQKELKDSINARFELQRRLDKTQKEKTELKEEIKDLIEENHKHIDYIANMKKKHEDKIRKLAQEYKPNQSNTFIESQERYIELVKKLELLGDDE